MSSRISAATLAEWAKRLVWVIFAVIIGWLLIASVFSTCCLGSYSFNTSSQATETIAMHTFYIQDNYIQHIIIFIIFSFLLIAIKADRFKSDIFNKYAPIIIFAVIGILCVLIVLAGQYYPKTDQKYVIEAAARLNDNIYSDFDVGEYLFRCPHQTGIVLYFQLLSVIFGNLNYVAFQLVNCLWIVLSCYFFMKIAGILWENKRTAYKTWIALIGLLFLPYLLYVTFLYGTVVGLTLALLSFYMMLLYEQNSKIHYLLICGLSIGIAVAVKSNYMIFMMAEIIYLLLKLISDKAAGFKNALSKIILIIIILGCFIFAKSGVNIYIKSINGGAEIKGVPMTAYIAMGLQDSKSAPGWYNGYNHNVYIENDYDYDMASTAAMNEIKRIVSGYPKDIKTSISFFVKKVSSQWNNPTFASLRILEAREGKDGLAWLLHGNGRYFYILWTNILQTWILAGMFLYAVMRFKKSSVEEIILPITFVGGFVFHIFWEANGYYAIMYFPLLLPLSICGYGEWRDWLLARKSEIVAYGWKAEETRGTKRKIIICITALIVICALSYTDPFAKMIARNDDTGVFNTYTQETVDEGE